MILLTQEVRDKVIRSRNLLFEAIELAEPSFVGDYSFDTQEDQLRFYMFMHSMTDAARGISAIAQVCEMTNEDLRRTCAENNVTLSEAIRNARLNVMGEIFSSMLEDLTKAENT